METFLYWLMWVGPFVAVAVIVFVAINRLIAALIAEGDPFAGREKEPAPSLPEAFPQLLQKVMQDAVDAKKRNLPFHPKEIRHATDGTGQITGIYFEGGDISVVTDVNGIARSAESIVRTADAVDADKVLRENLTFLAGKAARDRDYESMHTMLERLAKSFLPKYRTAHEEEAKQTLEKWKTEQDPRALQEGIAQEILDNIEKDFVKNTVHRVVSEFGMGRLIIESLPGKQP